MQWWIGWLVAIVAVGVAFWLWRKLAAERAHAAQLLYARIDAENQADALRANQAQILQTARQAALGGLLGEVSEQLHEPLQAAYADVESAKRQFADYRELVTRYDAAVQYCLQPVELIFGADKASLDQLVQHVEGARRKLFEARSTLEKNAVHRGSLLKGTADDLQPLAGLAKSLHGFSAATDSSAPADVNACLDDALRVLAPRFGNRIAVVCDYHDVPTLPGPADRLHEVFLHLLDNAARAIAADGKVTLTTRLGKGGDAVEVTIADSGEGITDEVLPNLFDAFFTTRAEQGAVGLGLTIAQQLVAERGGSIAVRSTRGLGSTFTLSLPLKAPATESTPAEAVAATTPAPGWASATR